MTGDAITRLTHELEICSFNTTNETEEVLLDPCGHPECEQMQVDIAVTLSVLVGILMVSCAYKIMYLRSGNFRVRKLTYDKFSCKKIS